MTQLVFDDIKNEKEMLREDRIAIEPAFKKVEEVYEVLDGYKFWLLQKKVMNNPYKMTFNPAEAKMQDSYIRYLYNTPFKMYWKHNRDIRVDVFFGLLLFILLTLLSIFIYIDLTHATTL